MPDTRQQRTLAHGSRLESGLGESRQRVRSGPIVRRRRLAPRADVSNRRYESEADPPLPPWPLIGPWARHRTFGTSATSQTRSMSSPERDARPRTPLERRAGVMTEECAGAGKSAISSAARISLASVVKRSSAKRRPFAAASPSEPSLREHTSHVRRPRCNPSQRRAANWAGAAMSCRAVRSSCARLSQVTEASLRRLGQ